MRYLDAVARLDAAASKLPNHEAVIPRTGSPSAAVAGWAAACGLTIAGGVAAPDIVPEAASRRGLLEQAGLPVASWVEQLNAGETVRIHVPSDTVPVPLAPDLWTSAVLRRRVPREQLVPAILADRRGALVYHGLMALDDETLAYLAGRVPLLSALSEHSPGALAQWGRAIHVANGRVQIPGGADAAALWAKVAGQAPADADRFIRGLLSRDGGRAAYFYDVVAHLDPARQAFALGATLARDRADRFGALYANFAATNALDLRGAWPVVRHPVDPGAVLAHVQAAADGRMAPPASRALWEAALSRSPQACSAVAGQGGDTDAAWLTERIEREFPEKRAESLAAVAFAQRVFAHVPASALAAVCETVASFHSHQALLLTFERMRLEDPADYVAAIRFADRLWAGVDRRAAIVQTAQAQGVLVVLERAVSARMLEVSAARRLAASLAALGSGSPGPSVPAPAAASLAAGAVGAWMRSTLLPALCGENAAVDPCVVRAVSGEGWPENRNGTVTWETERYRIDLGAATATRIGRIRAAQKATPIDDGLTLLFAAARLADPGAQAEDVQRAAVVVKTLASGPNAGRSELFGHGIPNIRASLRSAASRLASGPAAGERAEVASSLVEAGDLLLAEALVSFAYAVSIGEPDDAVLMAGDPSLQHRFDATIGPATPPWHLPDEVQTADGSWLTEGAVMGLHTVFARSWLRRLSIHDPGLRPRPNPQDVRAFGESEAIFNPFDLTDAGRDAIVGAIRRGRARLGELLQAPATLWKAAAEAGISEWRCRAVLWAARPRSKASDGGDATQPGPGDYVSLSELLWLGEPELSTEDLDRWGVSSRTVDGRLTPRMPRRHAWEDFQGPRGVGLLPAWTADVHLRAAEMLVELGLPGALAPGITSYVVWDVITTATMAHQDDWLAIVRAARTLPEDRTFDYVSTLTATGPLVPAK